MKVGALLIAFGLTVAPGLVFAQTGLEKEMDPEDRDAPLKVTSDRMVSDNKNNVIYFFGSVVALKGALKVEADEMTANTSSDQSSFTDIVATGSVRVTHMDKIATGERGVYSAKERTIVVTEDVTLVDHKTTATGEKVVYNLDTENMVLTGGEEKRSTLVLYPDKDKDIFYTLQEGAYKERERAIKRLDELKNSGHMAYMKPAEDKGKLLFRIRIGKYETPESAKKEQKRLLELENIETWLTTYDQAN